MDTFSRDKWIENNLPKGSSAEKMAFEVLMRVAYNEGHQKGQEEARAQHREDERERLHGPNFGLDKWKCIKTIQIIS